MYYENEDGHVMLADDPKPEVPLDFNDGHVTSDEEYRFKDDYFQTASDGY